jgi:hypothetical protein
MAISLYEATVPTFLQMLGSLGGVLEKARAHALAAGRDPDELVEARLVADMFPLGLQVENVARHSRHALEDAAKGAFTMPGAPVEYDYAGLQRLVAEAEAAVTGWTREAVNALEGREVVMDTGAHRIPFTAEAFLLSFSLPQFYFHAITAYDILRAKGAPIGKADYLGRLRTALEHDAVRRTA